jgi:hypothetical protein
VLTPWPSWLIAAHPSHERANPAALRNFLGQLTEYARRFDDAAQRKQADVDFIRERFGYEETDIRDWLKTVRWVGDCTAIPGKVIADTLRYGDRSGSINDTLTWNLTSILGQAGVVQRPWHGFVIEDFVNHEVVRLV